VYVARIVGAIGCFAVAIALSVLPGPAFVFWILGFVLLGFGVGQVLLQAKAVQEWMHRHVPGAHRWVPRVRYRHMRMILRHRWVQMLDRLSAHRERRRAERAARRAARLARRRKRAEH
jgi:hypothetical protein